MKECTCERCVGACKHQPGWFAPGEVEKAAALLGMTQHDFEQKYLVREYWVFGAGDVGPDHVPAPRKVFQAEGYNRASYADAWGDDRCVFLDENDRCKIHAAKPLECRGLVQCEDQFIKRHDINLMWLAKSGTACQCSSCEKEDG